MGALVVVVGVGGVVSVTSWWPPPGGAPEGPTGMVLCEGVARIRLLWSSVQMKRPGPLELVRCDMVTSAKLQWTCVCPYFSLISGVISPCREQCLLKFLHQGMAMLSFYFWTLVSVKNIPSGA